MATAYSGGLIQLGTTTGIRGGNVGRGNMPSFKNLASDNFPEVEHRLHLKTRHKMAAVQHPNLKARQTLILFVNKI